METQRNLGFWVVCCFCWLKGMRSIHPSTSSSQCQCSRTREARLHKWQARISAYHLSRPMPALEGSELIRYMSTLSTSLSTLAGRQAHVLSHMHCFSPLALAWAPHKTEASQFHSNFCSNRINRIPPPKKLNDIPSLKHQLGRSFLKKASSSAISWVPRGVPFNNPHPTHRPESVLAIVNDQPNSQALATFFSPSKLVFFFFHHLPTVPGWWFQPI